MSQQDILPLLTHEWQTTAQIVKAAGRLDPPFAEGTVKNNLLDLWRNEQAEREYRSHAAYWRLTL